MRRDFLQGLVGLALAAPLANMITESPVAMAAGLEDDEANPELGGAADSGPFALPVGARLQRDLAYGTDALQRLDVYHPAAAANAPVIFMVHGGGWSRGNKALWRAVKNKVTHWVGKGYLLVSTNYRMMPAADPLTQADDVAKALVFVQSHLRSWGGDPSRMVLMGHSSGAHLVALLTADPSISAQQGAAPWLATVSLDSAAMNVDALMRRHHLGLYDQVFKNDPTYWRQASPTLRLAGKPLAPLLAVCSTRRLDSCPQARAFAAKANQLGGHVDVLPVDLSHPEINAYLGSQGAYTDSVDAFLKSVGLP
jgi:arylformamidase